MFFDRLGRGLRHSLTLLAALPQHSKRTLLARMLAFSRTLPQQFNQPLPQMMAQLTPAATSDLQPLTPDDIRRLADAVAAWHLRSPLGICLRRSLLRYHFLRQAGLPVTIVFGARLKGEHEGGGIGGHAWLILNGSPYFENARDYTGFVEMYVYPENVERSTLKR